MDWLEQELKRALERKNPDPPFASRVSAAARRRRPLPRWVAVAASVVVLAGGGLEYRQYQGVRAKEQVLAALRLAGEKLNHVQGRVMEVGQ
jgi:cytochrome c-type biogenesis protein CcmH/NrfG